jgi:protein involved in polysaccharide export with SLBB domain
LEKLREAQTRLRDAIEKAKGFKISAEEAETVAAQLAGDIQKLTEDCAGADRVSGSWS